mgnify:CR=1 FL=1
MPAEPNRRPGTSLGTGVDERSTDRIRLTVPAAAAAVRIARAGAAGLATRAGFSYQEVEQLQLAVGEAAGVLAGREAARGRLELVFDVGPDALRVDLHLLPGAGRPGEDGDAPPGLPALAAAVFDSALDAWRVADDGRRLVLVKHHADADEDDD